MARTGLLLLLLLLLSLRGRNRTAGSIEWGLGKDKVKVTGACKGLQNGLIALLKSKIFLALLTFGRQSVWKSRAGVGADHYYCGVRRREKPLRFWSHNQKENARE